MADYDSVDWSPVDHDPFSTAVSGSDPRIALPQQTSEGLPYYQATDQPAPQQDKWSWRKDFIRDQRERDRLIAYMDAEVGGQGPKAQKAFAETVLNGSYADGTTVTDRLRSRYYPLVTHYRAARPVTDEMRAKYDPIVDEVEGGSNVSNYATGNASGTVGFNGGPRTASYGGENYGIEGQHANWAREMGYDGPLPAQSDSDPYERAAARVRARYPTREPDPAAMAASMGGAAGWGDVVRSHAQDLAQRLMTPGRAYQKGLTPEEEIEFGTGTAMSMAGRMPFAPKGAVGVGGGRITQPRYKPESQGFSLEDTFDMGSKPVPPNAVPVEHNPFSWIGPAPIPMRQVEHPNFHQAISDAKAAHPNGAAVTLYGPEDYAKMRTFTAPDGTAGFALNGDDIVSVFRHPNSPHSNAAQSMLASAVQQGGRRLDAFDTVLPHIYGKGGFRAVARLPFDPKYAPEGWSYDAFKKYNGGKPDVVFMVHDPYNPGYRPGDGAKVGSYDEAVALQKQATDAVSQRKSAGEQHFNQVASQITGLKGVSQYLTAPELERVTARNGQKLVDVLSQLPNAEEMAAVAYSGRAKRGWYQQSAQAISDIFGANDSRRFTGLLAALSPQNSVEMNTLNTLRTWNQWVKDGRPTDPKAINRTINFALGGATSVLPAWRGNTIRILSAEDPAKVMLSGPKVNSFAQNLRDSVHEVTNDAWMANYANIDQQLVSAARVKDPNPLPGYEPKIGVKSPGYLAMSAKVRNAAKVLSDKTGHVWTPAEIQETVWSWAKTLYEKASSRGMDATAEKLLKAADLTHKEIANTPDFALLFTSGIYRKILEEGGYGPKVAGVEQSLGRGGQRGRGAASQGTPLSSEGSGFTRPALLAHLYQAARRLDERRASGRALAEEVE